MIRQKSCVAGVIRADRGHARSAQKLIVDEARINLRRSNQEGEAEAAAHASCSRIRAGRTL